MAEKIKFDEIHTRKKQENLSRMMWETARAVLRIRNDTPESPYCPICRAPNAEHFTEKFGFALSRCEECRQIFCNPFPSKEQLSYYYNSAMKDFENEFFLESFEQRIPIFDRRIKIICSYMSSGKLLDVGSAVGIFLTALKRSRALFEIHCCDPSTDACRHLSERHQDITLHTMMIEDMTVDGAFDAVTMWDTLEHIQDGHAVARKVKTLLKPGGYWFFSTPNTGSFEWSVAGDNHVQLLPPGHINLYNIASISILLERAGLELIDHHTLNGSLDVGYVKKLLVGGEERPRINAGNFLADRLGDPIFADAFAEFLVTTKQGGNIFVVARRRHEDGTAP